MMPELHHFALHALYTVSSTHTRYKASANTTYTAPALARMGALTQPHLPGAAMRCVARTEGSKQGVGKDQAMVVALLTLPAVNVQSCQTLCIALIFSGLGLQHQTRALRPTCPLTSLRFSIPTRTGEHGLAPRLGRKGSSNKKTTTLPKQ